MSTTGNGQRAICQPGLPRKGSRRLRTRLQRDTAFNLDLASIVVRDCCWSSDAAAHAYSLDKAVKMYARIRSLDQVAAMLRA
jgi:hypothetical protein